MSERFVWVFSGTKDDSKFVWDRLPKILRDRLVLTPVSDDGGNWLRHQYCGLRFSGMVCDGKAKLSPGAFEYLMTRMWEGPWLFELDEYHKGLAEDWMEKSLAYYAQRDEKITQNIRELAKAMG